MGSQAPEPKSLLGYYRILSPSAGVRVSPLCLGAMNFGEAWKGFMGSCDKITTFEILDYFFEQGGNFIDTANGYQGEESEEWLGEWMASRKNRDQMVIATKYTSAYPSGKGGEQIKANFQGNHAKSMHLSLDASLKKLQTSYIDLFYVHWWDFTTSIPELMQSLNRVILNGKVLYLGVSDTPAWVVVKANEYARQHGLTQFSVYQGQWSAAERDFERDILPMCQAEGMGLAPWGPLGSGRFKSREQREREGEEGRKIPTYEKYEKVTEKLEAIAKKKGTLITSVALAYVMHKAPYVFPIVGGRKIKHLKGNIEALSLELSDEEIDNIESAVPFDVGFPMNMLFGLHDPKFKYSTRMTSKDINLVKEGAYLDTPEKPRPIRPHQLE
ncbi:norsolorinic acid reductase [Coniosporium apollinis CBS 100218]|uniref:Norsolorinic acid reductase n=1 Tax=Coniosporium apollinis (strain CBS 100218) TaxID=1168221 RepID=R7YVB1_CONA1|nr:norsolorinic acid reductase [Coniosporium apollinis CBS 100218]EON65847.1 norsolorinic acid reductase [Coniosporium apollinis CBS 100218]